MPISEIYVELNYAITVNKKKDNLIEDSLKYNLLMTSY